MSDPFISTKSQVIIIGAGMGGLATALALSSKGIPVTIVEKHSHAGGKIRQVPVAERLIDAGPTVFTMRWVFEKLFNEAGLLLNEHITLHENALLARHSWVGSDVLDLYSDVQQSAEAISHFAGAREAEHYRAFAKKAESLFETLNAPFMQSERPNPLSLTFAHGTRGVLRMAKTQPYLSLWKALSSHFKDPRLVQLFARYATYCGSSPLQAPATLMLIAHVERAGVWVIDGGMQSLANALHEAAQSFGCESRFNCSATRILTDASGVSGVQLDTGEVLHSRTIVFNGDTNALSRGSLGTDCKSAVAESHANSLSALTRCQVAESQGFELAHHNVFFGTDYPDEFDAIFKRKTLCSEPTVYVCAQDRLYDQNPPDTHHNTPQHERLFSLMNAPAGNMSTSTVERADRLMTQQLRLHGLELIDPQGDAYIETPNSFSALFPETDGALYGRPTHGMMGSFKRPGATTAVVGLYLVGGSVHPGPGVPMATLSGQIAAKKIICDWSHAR